MAAKAAETQTLFVPLSLMQALLAEIERLHDLQSGNRPGVNEVPDEVIVMKHKDIRT
jgi:hypothetical protein